MKPNVPQHRWLRRLAAALAFAALTVVLCLGLNFLLVDDIHSYTRVMLGELYTQSGQINTLFLGSSHCYRSFDPQIVDERLGTRSFNAGSSQQLPDGSFYLLRQALARNDLDTVYLETFFTGYNQEKSSNVPLACYLLTDYMDPLSIDRYAYLWEMGGAAAFLDLIFPARHSIASPEDLPDLWTAKLTDGYDITNYSYVTYRRTARNTGAMVLCTPAGRRRMDLAVSWMSTPTRLCPNLDGKTWNESLRCAGKPASGWFWSRRRCPAPLPTTPPIIRPMWTL